jgi:hypothetical protein
MSVFWPDVDDSKRAHQACLNAGGMAFFVALVTGIVAWLQISGKIKMFPGIDKVAFIDVGLFIFIGIGLFFHSRIAAIGGLLLYIAERILMIKMAGFQASQVVAIVIFGLAFINGVRGSFAWHEQKKIAKGEVFEEVQEEIGKDKPKKNFPFRTIFLLLALIAVGAIAYFFLIHKGSVPTMASLKQQTKTLSNTIIPKKSVQLDVAPQGPSVKLKLKSGRTFEGVLVKKNSEGYWVFMIGTGEVFFSINEVLEVS